MVVQLFNLGHFLLLIPTLIISVLLIALFAVWSKKKSKEFTKVGIAIILFIGFVAHFARLFLLPEGVGRSFPSAYMHITPMTISSFNAITFPFIFLFGSKKWKNYMFYIGVISGFLANLMPIYDYGRPAFEFDTIRFFINHGIVYLGPILMVICGHHKINWRAAYFVPFTILSVMAVILINEVMVTALGIVDQSMGDLLSNVYRNGAMVFGPEARLGGPEKFFDLLCPEVFKTALFDIPSLGIARGDTLYIPIFWAVAPIAIVVSPACLLVGILLDFKNFRRDITYFWYTVTRQTSKRDVTVAKKLSRLKGSVD